jgi:putative ABC transport system permease protein
MIRFLLKGLMRDRHRSFFPILIITLGVATTTLTYCFMQGFTDEMIRTSARLDTGHVKVMTRGYHEIASQVPNDLAIPNVQRLIQTLEQNYPDLEWTPRIKFGGLIDFPDSSGETRTQGPAIGIACDLISPGAKEITRLNLDQAVVQGRLPQRKGEFILSDEFSTSLGVKLGETGTLIGSTANGGMAIHNFTLVGTVRFGIAALDRNSLIADLGDIQAALDMEGSASEVLGFFPNSIYNEKAAARAAAAFNMEEAGTNGPIDDSALVMVTLREQNGLGDVIKLANLRIVFMLGIFVVTMSLVLWNAGLRSGIRRYGEMGIRLALGESKLQVFGALMAESILIGLAGSAIGTAIGLGISYYLQEVGWDMTDMIQGSNVMVANVIRAKITIGGYLIGFVPGLAATFLGTAFSGQRIFKRETSQLFKELET